jgi:nucleolar protein 4
MAMTREGINKLQENRKNGLVHEDKRNLYLLQEGLILKDDKTPKADLEKRLVSYQQRKEKLKNPNFYISKTRLSVRNLPVNVTEKELKAKCSCKVKQVKIVRQKERLDKNKNFRSMGYGFLELYSHEDALKELHNLNNQPNLFPEKKRLIVEFAIENSKIVQKRESRYDGKAKPERCVSKQKIKDSKPVNKDDRSQKKHFEKKSNGKNIEKNTEKKTFEKVKPIIKQKIGKEVTRSRTKRKAEETDDFDKMLHAYKKKLAKSSEKWE